MFVKKEVTDKEVSAGCEVNAASIATTVSAAATIITEEVTLKRRKHFAAKAVEEKRNKPPTQAQQRRSMCTYLKNVKGKKPKDLKNWSFDSIQKMFDRAFNRVNTFVDFKTELVEGSSKRVGEELTQESTKKKKMDDDKETTELKQLMKINPDEEEVAIDAIPLAVKSLKIVDWKIHKEGKNCYYQIIIAYGKSKMYMVFNRMLKEFDREDLEDLYNLVKSKYGSTWPVEDLDLLLCGDLKTMFEPHVEDAVWRKQQGYKVLEWKLYDSYGVDDEDDEEMEVDEKDEDDGVDDNEDETEVINVYEEVDPLNRPSSTSDEETEFAPPVVSIADTNNEPIPPVI
nr:hypothetical protein [Tanacetum cinerariifolium]